MTEAGKENQIDGIEREQRMQMKTENADENKADR